MSDVYSVLLGDIHDSNALGQAIGSLERRIDILQTLLDFFAFTGHSIPHVMEPMKNRRGQTPAAAPKKCNGETEVHLFVALPRFFP